MAKLELLKVDVTPSKMCKPSDSIKFELTFNNQAYLPDDVEFEVVYMGDTYNEKRDQKLCENVIGPLEAGKLCFQLETTPVDLTQIPIRTLFGLTTILIVGKYHEQQFIRIGYVVDVKHNGVESEKLVEADQQSEEEDEEDSEEGDSEDTEGEEVEILEDAELENEETENVGCVEKRENSCCAKEAECCADEEESCDSEEEISCSVEGCEEECMCGEGEEDSEGCCEEGELNLGDALEKALAEALKPKNRAEIPFETPIVAGKDEFEYLGIPLNQSKIEMHFLEKPIIQVFEIDWCNEEPQEAIKDSSEENTKNETEEKSAKRQKVE